MRRNILTRALTSPTFLGTPEDWAEIPLLVSKLKKKTFKTLSYKRYLQNPMSITATLI